MTLFLTNKGQYETTKSVPNEQHRIIVKQENGEEIVAILADQENDPKDINNSTHVKVVSDDEIASNLKKGGAYNIMNHLLGPLYMLKESNASRIKGGKLDYTGGGEYDIVPDSFYITMTKKEGSVAHNGYNYGNFLWGASAKALGVPLPIAKFGAHFNNFFFDPNNKGSFDSKDDQFSISVGYHWQKQSKHKQNE